MRAILFLLLAAVPVRAIDFDFNARDLNTPVFDSSGHLLRRLLADSAVGPYDLPRLNNGQVTFFSPDSDQQIAVLNFDHALYHRLEDNLSGDDAVKLVTAQETVAGRGYECQLTAGLLKLRSEVTYDSADIHLTGDRGEMRFDPKGGNKDTIVKDALVIGNVVVVPAAGAKAEFDRAETDSAHYDATLHKVFLKIPITIWKNGQKSLINISSGLFEIDLKEKPGTAPAAPDS